MGFDCIVLIPDRCLSFFLLLEFSCTLCYNGDFEYLDSEDGHNLCTCMSMCTSI